MKADIYSCLPKIIDLKFILRLQNLNFGKALQNMLLFHLELALLELFNLPLICSSC